MGDRPSGTVTFLFTDIEGSTRLWEDHPTEMAAAVERHDQIMRSAIEDHDGYVFTTAGDAFCAAFARAGDAVAAALVAQTELAAEGWPEPVGLRARMGLHTGEAQERDGDYFGPTLNHAARLMSAGSGGQVLVSGVCAGLCRTGVPPGAQLVDAGLHRLRDLTECEHVFDLVYPARPDIVGPLRTVDTLPGNLPARRTELLGRVGELARLVGDVHTNRLVTLSGVGGVGKTSLALALAAELQPQFRDGAWLVELGGVVTREAVVAATASTLGVDTGETQGLDALVGGLAPRETLIIVDNCGRLYRWWCA